MEVDLQRGIMADATAVKKKPLHSESKRANEKEFSMDDSVHELKRML